jgi:hypothetical protein
MAADARLAVPADDVTRRHWCGHCLPVDAMKTTYNMAPLGGRLLTVPAAPH